MNLYSKIFAMNICIVKYNIFVKSYTIKCIVKSFAMHLYSKIIYNELVMSFAIHIHTSI